MKTARFMDVVTAAGRPQVHPLWLAPDRDPGLKRAVRDCRVMTVHQALRGTKKDYGTVGLHLEGSTQVLVFPKSLRRFGDRHIVGIDYKLILQPQPTGRVPAMPAAPSNARLKHKKVEARPPTEPHQREPKSQRLAKPEPARAERGLHLKAEEKRPPLTRDELLAEIRGAVRELKAGKAVAAYERLSGVSKGA
jgi:hypothetical protein